MIEIKNLNKYYNRHKKNEIHVINNTSISLPDKGFVCIVGESGSGKTTLLNTISGLDSFKSGSIQVNNIKLEKYTMGQADKIRQANYGYIFQNYYLLTNRSVYENVNMVLDEFNISKEEKKRRIYYVLEAVGLFRYRNKLVSNLSGGEQQRVSIARALVKTPNVIFADEPTGSLDEKNTLQVLNILKKLSKDYLIVMVTHEARLVNFYADRILYVENGTIVADKTVTDTNELSIPMDRNIYLKEIENVTTEKVNGSEINVYDDDEEHKDIKVNIVYQNGKAYVKVIGDNVEIVNTNAEIDMIDDHPAKVTDETIDEFKYDLEPIDSKKIHHIGFFKLIKYAIDNIKFMKWRNLFLYIVLIAVSVVSVISLDDFSNLQSIDYQKVVTKSYGNVDVTMDLANAITKDDLLIKFDNLYNELSETAEKEEDVSLYCTINTAVFYTYDVFDQTQGNIEAQLGSHDFKTLDMLDESTLIYGKMPEKDNEIVMDEWTLQGMLDKNPLLANLTSGIYSFVGKTFQTGDRFGGRKMVLTGICHNESPTVYVDKFFGISLLSWGTKIGSIERLKKENPEVYGKYDLNEGEVITNLTYEGYSVFNSKYDATDIYNVVDCIDMDYDVIMNEKSLVRYIRSICDYNFELIILSNGNLSAMNECINNFNTCNEEGVQIVKINSENTYENEVRSAYLNTLNSIKSRLIVTATMLIFALFIIYFAMKSSASRQINDIAVFRALGFSRFSFSLIYVVELFIISLFTTLVGVTVTSLVFVILDGIPLIDFTMHLSFAGVCLLTLCLFAANIIIGLLPISSIMRLTPSKIYTKYDL